MKKTPITYYKWLKKCNKKKMTRAKKGNDKGVVPKLFLRQNQKIRSRKKTTASKRKNICQLG